MDDKLTAQVIRRYKQAAIAAAWGSALDAWLESTLEDLTTKAARARKVPMRIVDGVYRKDTGYYRSRLGGENSKGFFNLNLHLEFVSGLGVKFTIELHQGQDLDRLAEVRAGYTDPAARKFVPALAKALKELEFPS